MHLSYEELLDARDGEARAETARHVATCPACTAEVERLRKVAADLRALPVAEPPWDRWPAVRAALAERQRRRRLAYLGYGALALAASIALVMIMPGVGRPSVEPQPVAAPGTRSGEAPSPARAEMVRPDDLARLVAESQRLEGILRRMGSDPGVLDVRAASAVVSLEDEIAWIDQTLASPAVARAPRRRVEQLWQERVDLMRRLVRAREARPVYVGL